MSEYGLQMAADEIAASFGWPDYLGPKDHLYREVQLLLCRDCDEGTYPLPIPFDSERERGKWAIAHSEATGHNNYLVRTERR